VGRAVARHEQVCPAIIVDVDGYRSQPAPDVLVRARRAARVGKSPVTVAAIKRQWRAFSVGTRSTVGGCATELTSRSGVERHLAIVTNDHIEPAVAVVIKPCGSR